MTYKIIGDSCLDLTRELKKDPHFQTVPLTLQVGQVTVTDDEQFDQKAFIQLMKNSPECPKTACPSPERFKEAYACPEENVFVICLSEHLSGTYSSACLGKKLYEEEYGKKNICVLSSDSAAAGELNLALYIRDLCEQSVPFEEIVKRASAYRDDMKTYFVLESLDYLRKNGRLSGLQAFFATTLNIKPVMAGDKGVIVKVDQARGITKALQRMCDHAVRAVGDTRERTLVISHCNCPERAQFVKEEMEKRGSYRDVVITEGAGVTTVYANDGGIVIAL
ncbi:MAG TPA: DegV family protein [Candidatus Cottocaccamicrobium excrementipullorum]|nr:DegV family protein [Candidatus Cottocaccamicrobium excrementipullorum]